MAEAVYRGNRILAVQFMLFGLDLDDLFNVTGITGDFSPLRDALGSVLALTDLSGNVAGTYTYDPYGNTTNAGEDPTQFQYLGRENDTDDAIANPNGIYYLRNRYYSRGLGRFLSRDPIGIAGGVNLYAYAGDDPTDFADHRGWGRGWTVPNRTPSSTAILGVSGALLGQALKPMRSQGGLGSDIPTIFHGQNGARLLLVGDFIKYNEGGGGAPDQRGRECPWRGSKKRNR